MTNTKLTVKQLVYPFFPALECRCTYSVLQGNYPKAGRKMVGTNAP
jgi:hypothetical protein